MTTEERLARLEGQNRNLKRLFAVAALGLASVLAVAAAAPDKPLDFREWSWDGKHVAEANAKGGVKVKKVELNGQDLADALEAHEKAIQAHGEAIQAHGKAIQASQDSVAKNPKPQPRPAFGKPASISRSSSAIPGLWSGKAETDGFLIAYTGGTGTVSELYISADGSRVRTANAAYTSLVCPVAAGEKWEVRAYADSHCKNLNINPTDCDVYWLPLQVK